MLKLAYQLGIKLAMAEAGLLPEEEAGNPADQLAAVLQQIPDVESEPPKPKKKGIGDPEDNTSFGERSTNYAFDDLSHLGLDIQGPESTAV
jgi:hypothetical protein